MSGFILLKEKRSEGAMRGIAKGMIISVILIALLIQTGCWDQKIYENIGFILQLGLELDENEKLIYTASIPIIGPDIEGKVDVFTTSNNLLRASREDVRHVSGKVVEGGKIQHLYFSKELAQRGIVRFMEVFIRNTENPLLANIIIVDGSPKEMMEISSKYKNKPRPTSYVNDLLVSARMNSYAPETRIYDYSIEVYSRTIDPIAPLIKYNEQEIEMAGAALFNGDKLVGEIDTAKTGILHALMGTNRLVHYMYGSQDKKEGEERLKGEAAVLIKKINRKVNIYINNNRPHIDINLNLTASLDEYSIDSSLDNQEEKKRVEEEIAGSIKEDCIKLLGYLQQVGSDPLGIGEMFRAKHNWYWKSVEWKEVYKIASFNVNVNLIFEFYGAIS